MVTYILNYTQGHPQEFFQRGARKKYMCMYVYIYTHTYVYKLTYTELTDAHDSTLAPDNNKKISTVKIHGRYKYNE